jgi:hypothetical protein
MARLARHVAADEWRPFARTLRTSILIGAALGVSAVLLAMARPVVLRRRSGGVRAPQQRVGLARGDVGTVVVCLFLGTALDAMPSYGIQPWIHGTTAIVIAVACWRRFRGMGSTWSMMTATPSSA